LTEPVEETGADVLSLEAAFYADPQIHAREREKIFFRSWQFVAAAKSLAAPGDYRSLRIIDRGVFVIRGRDGALRGFHDVCRHRGSRLFDADSGNCDAIRCRYHGWTYDDRGALIDTPWFLETSPFELSRWPLDTVSVEEWRGLVFVSISPEQSLAEQLGDLPATLADTPLESFCEVSSETIRAPLNWKIYLDQFNEYYHVPSVHRPTQGLGLERYTALPAHNMACMLAPPGSAFYGGKWLWGWPNWTLSVFAGGMKVGRINPVAPDSIDVQFHYFFADTGDGEAQRRVIDATREIFDEDVRACVRVQANHNSGAYRPGPLHPRHEQATAYFQARVRTALTA
jgi:choline monooxygenase